MKIKKKDWVIKSFSLPEDILGMLEEQANYEGLNKSEFLEHLIRNWQTSINPADNLIELQKQKEILQEKINFIEGKIKVVTKQIKLFSDWDRQKKVNKEKAMPILKRKILEREFNEAERLAKTWQKLTGISAIELLIEAKEEVEKEGI